MFQDFLLECVAKSGDYNCYIDLWVSLRETIPNGLVYGTHTSDVFFKVT